MWHQVGLLFSTHEHIHIRESVNAKNLRLSNNKFYVKMKMQTFSLRLKMNKQFFQSFNSDTPPNL